MKVLVVGGGRKGLRHISELQGCGTGDRVDPTEEAHAESSSVA